MAPHREQLETMLDWSPPSGRDGERRLAAYLVGILVGAAVAVVLIVGLFPAA